MLINGFDDTPGSVDKSIPLTNVKVLSRSDHDYQNDSLKEGKNKNGHK